MDYKQLMKAQSTASKIQKELDNTIVESESNGLVLTFKASGNIEKVDFEELNLVKGLSKDQLEELKKSIFTAIEKGMKQCQKITSEQMNKALGDLKNLAQ